MDFTSNEFKLVVIKVKYEDTLRRFSINVRGDSVDHNMDRMKAKIIDLFKFRPDAAIILTYTDVDGDLVTLVNDDELLDAIVHQQLNPLRLNVVLNGTPARESTINTEQQPGNSSQFGEQSCYTSFQMGTPNIDSSIAEAFKYVPEQLGDALSMLTQDLVSKASASAPAFINLVEQFTRSGRGHAAPLGNANVNGGGAPVEPLFGSCSTSTVGQTSKTKVKQTESGDNPKEDVGGCTTKSSTNATGLLVSLIDQEKQNCEAEDHSTSAIRIPGFTVSVSDDINSKHPGNIPSVPDSTSKTRNSASSSREIDATAPVYGPSNHFRHIRFPHRRSHCRRNNSHHVFHKNIRCAGCGMHPITGPRYSSIVEENYNLCNICFSEVGNEVDYTRTDEPQYRYPQSFCRNQMPHAFRGHVMRSSRGKLESHFVQDVTIPDGTQMPLSHSFTKIWRMHNNGTSPWPVGTHLVWIGGDELSETNIVELEIPMNGFPVGEEMDIAVNLLSPSCCGRYTSSWRLCTPYGLEFGQRIWVLIEVDADLAASEFYRRFDLNLPSMTSDDVSPVIVNTNAEPLDYISHPELDHKGFQNRYMKLADDEEDLDNSFQSLAVEADPNMANNGFGFTHVPQMASLGSYPTGDALPIPSINSTQGKIRPTDEVDLGYYEKVDNHFQSVTIEEANLDMANNGFGFTHVPQMASLGSYPTGNTTKGKDPSVLYPNINPIPRPSIALPEMDLFKLNHFNNFSSHSANGPDAPVVSYPINGSSMDLSLPPVSVQPSASASAPVFFSDPPPTLSRDNESSTEQALLKELKNMGFNQNDLNKEVLRMNQYDLKQSVDDLCGGRIIDDWDPLLSELQEMGFSDMETNRKLLIKNDGSIKRVVLDLISEENAE